MRRVMRTPRRCSTLGQRLAIGAAVLLAVAGVFAIGTTAGAALNDQFGAMSVARVPLREMLPRGRTP